jgi:TRAP-type C4-dicarboxylate transport system permease small subunit
MRFGKVYSVYSDLRTHTGSLVFLAIGVLFLVMTVLQAAFHLFSPAEDLAGILVAVTMLFFGAGLILFFFSRMFGKLAQIASEIENDESLRDDSQELSCEDATQKPVAVPADLSGKSQ